MTRVARLLGWVSGLGFVALALAGADWPPPPGFAVLIAIGVLLGLAVAVLLPKALTVWRQRGAAAALWRSGALGMAAALASWALLGALPFSGEPSSQPPAAHILIGFATVGLLGALGAAGVVIAGRLLTRVKGRD